MLRRVGAALFRAHTRLLDRLPRIGIEHFRNIEEAT